MRSAKSGRRKATRKTASGRQRQTARARAAKPLRSTPRRRGDGASTGRASRFKKAGVRVKAAGKRKAARAVRPARRGIPNAIGFVSHHMDYTSQDLVATRRFYAELLGFTRAHHDPDSEHLFITTSATSSIGFTPPLPGPPEEWRPPREPMLYFMVEDVDRVYRELTAQGLSFDHPPTDMTWGHRTARLQDPEGRIVCFAQEIER